MATDGRPRLCTADVTEIQSLPWLHGEQKLHLVDSMLRRYRNAHVSPRSFRFDLAKGIDCETRKAI